ncbi:MAG TPA: hypothetical protein VFA62_08860 [Acidimicrobiia bacterium]|nr:hypothetical protein [Acidimicrobiia bacterium]
MAIVGRPTKQPAERIAYSMDFGDRIQPSDSIASALVTARDKASGADRTTDLVSGPNAVTGTVVTQPIHAGIDGSKYIVTFQVTTTNGLVYEDELQIKVKET